VRKLLTLAITLCGMAITAMLLAPVASAHAVVVGSDPADGARLAKAPSAVTIRFDESVGLSLGYLRVVDQAGRRVDTGSATHPAGIGSSITVSLKSGLGDGSYLASFRVVSADSHPIAGSIRFVVGTGPLGVSEISATTKVDRGVAIALPTAHWLSFAGVGVVGGSWLIFTLWPAGQRRRVINRVIWAGWTAAVVGALGEFVLQGPYAAGSSLASATKTGLLDATLHANTGQLLSLRMVLLGVLGAVLTALLVGDQRRPSWGPEAAAIVSVGIVVTFAAGGHSQSANPRWLAVLVDSLHFTAMMVWLGGLVIIAIGAFSRADTDDEELAAEQDELAAGLPIFSRVALISILTLAGTGTIQAWRELGTVDAITTTWYGKLVITKVVLFTGLVLLGYTARRVLASRMHGRGTLLRLRRGLVVEVVVGAALLAASGILISQPPGKVSLAALRAKPKHATVTVTNTAQAQVDVTPGTAGPVQVTVTLTGNITPIDVSASASLPSRQLGPIPMALQAIGPKTYTASDVVLPSPGRWEISVTVKTSEFDSTTAVARLPVS
jgi:copper transport protein